MREQWSKRGLVLASIGSAVGIGNIWRFPYLVGKSGGGAFLIPYIIAIIAFALPIMLLEFAVGRKFGGSVLSSFKKINSKIKYFGLIPIMISLFILSYYLVIAGWTLAYFVFSFNKYLTFEFFTSNLGPLFFFLAALLIAAAVVKLGIRRGIEKTSMYLLTLLFFAILILLGRAITLPNALEGIRFFLTPNLSALSNVNIWMLAFGQAFFSVSVGYGILLTYGSYMTRKENIPASAVRIAGADTLTAILAGFIIFPIVFSFGLSPAAGPELAFITLPKVFSSMLFGMAFGAVFFFLLFVGALTSAVSMLEVGVTSLIDELKFSRLKSTFLVSLFVLVVGLPSVLSYAGFNISLLGKPFLDSMDFIFGTLLTPLGGAVTCLFVAWFWGKRALILEINRNRAKWNIPYWTIYLYKFVIPIVLIGLFIVELL